MIKKIMVYRRLSVFLLIILFLSCKSPWLPKAPDVQIPKIEKKVVFEFDGEIKRKICEEGTFKDKCQITGHVKNTGDAVAYKCCGTIKIFSDVNRTIEIPSTSGNWYRIDRAFNPGDKERFDTYTLDEYLCEDIKVIEIVLTFNYEEDLWGESKSQIISFVFN